MKIQRLFVVVLILGTTIAGAGEPASADPRQTFLTAPYAEATSDSSCFDGLGLTGSCTELIATSDATTGAFRVALEVATPNDGALPGLATAGGTARLKAVDARSSAASAVLYVLTLAISERSSHSEGLTAPFLGTPRFSAQMTLAHDACQACFGSAAQELAVGGPGTVQVLAVLINPSGAAVPAGNVTITLAIDGQAQVVGAGTLRGSVEGTLTQIEAAAPSLERTIVAPYASADAIRSCEGSIGTTFTCWAAAAGTTGRAQMDLGVTSPVAGTLPGSGNAFGETSVVVADPAAAGVRGVVYALNLHVTSADAYVPVDVTPVIGSAFSAIDAGASLSTPTCQACTTGGAVADLVGGPRPPFMLDDDVPFVVWATTNGLAQSPGGTIQLRVTGNASLDDTAGNALARLDAVVSSVRAIEIA